MADLKDRIIGGFRVLQEIQAGSGSQGTVYKAVCDDDKHHLVPIGTIVALKVMAVQDEDQKQWRKLEKRTNELVRLNHPNVVKYYGCFSEANMFNDVHIVVQEFLQGETLKERLARMTTGLDVDVGRKIAEAAVDALVYTTSLGIVHRDIKPGNIFLCDDGSVKLIDFEIARQRNGTTTDSVGNFRGSFDYMAPDFTNPEFHGDAQSDIFSMGVVLHEILTGKTPYQRVAGDDKQANFAFLTRWAHVLSDDSSPIHVSSRIRRLLAHTEEVMERSLSPRRTVRYPDFATFRQGLSNIRFRNLRNPESDNSYQMLQFIGKGGFGEVFKARLKRTGQLVAIKHLLKAEYAERFHREAKIMQKINDPCFVRFVDFFVLDSGNAREAFLVMAFLNGMPGSSLRDAIKQARGEALDEISVLRAFVRYAHGLAALHREGIFHRDIKPSNLYFPKNSPEEASIMDLGIARDTKGTATHGQVPGTLDYMPPEVVTTSNRGDAGMDIYALGLCLFEALTGHTAYPRLPAGEAAYLAFFDRAKSRIRPMLDDPAVRSDPELLSLLTDMTQPDQARRLKDALIVERRLRKILSARTGESVELEEEEIAPTYSGEPSFTSDSTDMSRSAESVTGGTIAAGSSDENVLAQERKRLIEQQKAKPQHQGNEPPKQSDDDLSEAADRAQRIWRISLALVAVLTVSVAGVLAWHPILAFLANRQCEEIVAAYDKGDLAGGKTKRADWIARWDSERDGLIKLSKTEYSQLKGKIDEAKRKTEEKETPSPEPRPEPAADTVRADLLQNLSVCLKPDGRLNEENFLKMHEHPLPQTLEGDAEIDRQTKALRSALVEAIRDRLANAQLASIDRQGKARELLQNPWTKRILSAEEVEKTERLIEDSGTWCIVEVKNRCSDDVTLDGRTLKKDASRTVVYKDGHSEKGVLSRAGYKPFNLDPNLNGKIFEVADDMFIPEEPKRIEKPRPTPPRQPKPQPTTGTLTIPTLEKGVTCLFKGKEVTKALSLKSGEYAFVYRRMGYAEQKVSVRIQNGKSGVLPLPGEWKALPVRMTLPKLPAGIVCKVDGKTVSSAVELQPGEHACAYERTDYQTLRFPFVVRVAAPAELPLPKEDGWRPTTALAHLRKAQEFVAGKKWTEAQTELDLANVHSEENGKIKAALEKEIAAGLAEIDQDKRKILMEVAKKLADVPVATRRKRLEEAEQALNEAVSSNVLTEEEAKSKRNEIQRKKAWTVGTVRNACAKRTIEVGGKAIPAGEEELFVFEDGLPKDWACSAEGYETKVLSREFDGAVLTIRDEDLVAKESLLSLPKVDSDVICLFEGEPVSKPISLKPGAYVCRYRRPGYADQEVAFRVQPGTDETLPPPAAWKALAVRIAVPKLPDGIVCRIDGDVVKAEARLLPGEHTREYERVDYQVQTLTFTVRVAEPVELSAPEAWQPTDGLTHLTRAAELAEAGKWSEAEKELALADVQSAKNKERAAQLKETVKRGLDNLNDERKLRVKEFLDRLARRLVAEPVEDRQDRLSEAETLLKRAIDVDRILTEEDAGDAMRDIRSRKYWTVGKVQNDCQTLAITVAGRAIPAGRSELFVFTNGVPKDWSCQAEGYEKKILKRSFDGMVLTIQETDLDAKDVVVSLPKFEKGVECYYVGTLVEKPLSLKPGSYSVNYRRPGYYEQDVSFDVQLGKDRTLPSPKQWKAKPVKVSVPSMEEGVDCRIDGKRVVSHAWLMPGRHTQEYERVSDHQIQTNDFTVAVNAPLVLSGPKPWAEPVPSPDSVSAPSDTDGWVKKAGFAYQDELYYEVVTYFHEAYKGGYRLTAEDREMEAESYEKAMKDLQTKQKICWKYIQMGKTPIWSLEDLETKLKNLPEWHRAVSR